MSSSAVILDIPARWTRGRRSGAPGDCREPEEGERREGGFRRLVGTDMSIIAPRHELRDHSLAAFFCM